MCGINGFNFRDKHLVQKMNNRIKHRGPDDEGVFIDDGVSLGHVRLAIIDPSSKGHQPMMSSDGTHVIVYNGELYNFPELKKELENKNYVFRSNTDTEVVLNAYLEYGDRCLEKFNGMFAFAIWNKRSKELFAARDHIGIKPFFYYYHNKKFVFSSEIKSILFHNIRRELNITALNLYFRFSYVNGPETIFENIYKLLPAHYLKLKNDEFEIKRYWKLEDKTEINSFTEARQRTRETFDDAVKRQLISDKPLGLFLSGGIDSTAILGSMSKNVSHRIKTFSVKFATDIQEEKFNADSEFAQKTSQFYKTDHNELLINAKDVSDYIEEIVYCMDDLVSNHTQIAPYLLSRMAKQQVDVVLSGDGGDEIFGGYKRYYYYNLIKKWQKIPKSLRKNSLLQGMAKILNYENIYRKINLSNLELFWQFRSQNESLVQRILKPEYNQEKEVKDELKRKHFSEEFRNYASDMMRVDIASWLVDESLTKSDKLSMAWGLEQRVPVLDKELVELAFAIPEKFKIHQRNQGKFIFKEAVKDYLPDYIYDKPKTGWFAPSAKWLRTGTKDLAYEILSENYNQDTKEFFNFNEIAKVLDNHLAQREYALNIIWALITFQIWYKLFINDLSR